MRVSIWRQWASNHSADFNVVGTFPTPERAQQAAEEVRQLILAVSDWYARPENAEANKARWERGKVPLSPPEIAIGERYSIDWGHRGIDWTWPERDHETVHVFECLVFVENTGNTYTGPSPFDQLLARLGGKVVYDIEGYNYLYVNLTCVAPDEETAQQIVALAQASVTEFNPNDRMPGIHYLDDVEIKQEGSHLSFHKMFPFEIYVELPAAIAFLKERGCTAIEYEVKAA